MNNLEPIYNKEMKQIKNVVEEIKQKQENLISTVEKNHKINMKKFQKLHEFNEIEDMTNNIFETRIARIEKLLEDINSKIA